MALFLIDKYLSPVRSIRYSFRRAFQVAYVTPSPRKQRDPHPYLRPFVRRDPTVRSIMIQTGVDVEITGTSGILQPD